MMELFLSSDGKHTVHVSTDTPEKLAELLPQAATLYEEVVRRFGNKAQLWQQAATARAGNDAAAQGRADAVREAAESSAPRCPLHGKKMVFRRGRFGGFWSCPARTPGGRWCRYTVDVPEAGHDRTAKA